MRLPNGDRAELGTKLGALRFPLSTAKGTGPVLSVWIVRHGEDFPRLTTCSANKRTGGFCVIVVGDKEIRL